MEKGKKTNVTNDNINPQADTLTDLPVAGEQAEETKGGAEPASGSTSMNLVLCDGSVRTVR